MKEEKKKLAGKRVNLTICLSKIRSRFYFSFFAGAFVLLLVSSTVTMAVPFALGTVIDTIYTKDSSKMQENLNKLCFTLTLIFIVGATCNFGRIYLMNISGELLVCPL
jgi:ABC-type multidrug transport system fused ATPase/permease subunit